jgi:hypothetical protein
MVPAPVTAITGDQATFRAEICPPGNVNESAPRRAWPMSTGRGGTGGAPFALPAMR